MKTKNCPLNFPKTLKSQLLGTNGNKQYILWNKKGSSKFSGILILDLTYSLQSGEMENNMFFLKDKFLKVVLSK